MFCVKFSLSVFATVYSVAIIYLSVQYPMINFTLLKMRVTHNNICSKHVHIFRMRFSHFPGCRYEEALGFKLRALFPMHGRRSQMGPGLRLGLGRRVVRVRFRVNIRVRVKD